MNRHEDLPGDSASKTQRDRDALLAELLAELTDRLRRGDNADVETMAGRHPELAEELRDLWAAASIAEEVAGRAAVAGRLRDHGRLRCLARPAAIERRARIPCSVAAKLLEELGRGGMGRGLPGATAGARPGGGAQADAAGRLGLATRCGAVPR